MSKNKRIQYFVICILGFIMYCCEKKVYIDEGFIIQGDVTIIQPMVVNEPIDIESFLDSVKYIKLELTDESIIGYIQKIVIFENKIYILDTLTSSLFVFNIDGGFLFKIANIGHGPKEYIQLDFFEVDQKKRQLVLFDIMGYWVHRYDLDGNFLSRQKIPLWVEGATPTDEGYAFYTNFRHNKEYLKQEYNIVLTNESNTFMNAYFPYNSTDISDLELKFATPQSGCFYSYNKNVSFFEPNGNRIFEIKKDTLHLKYMFDFGDKTFDNQIWNNYGKIPRYLETQEFFTFRSILENNLFLIFQIENSSSSFSYTGFYSKETEQNICSLLYFIDSDQIYLGNNMAAYDEWIVSQFEVDYLISWKEGIAKMVDNNNLPPILKKRIDVTNNLTIDDNPVLMFYKLKSF